VTEGIVTQGLGRSFGPVKALDGFDMTLPAGKVVALVGPNGSGKTTLLLVLAGLLAPDRGTASVGGLDPVTDPYGVHKLVGWMPDFFGVYEGLSVVEYLDLFGAAYGMSAVDRAARAEELVQTTGLDSFADKPVHALSRGQKQRLGFARTLVHRPSVLLLDEPASGLDPRARIELRELVRKKADEGVTVVVSSHILAELEEMADVVAFVEAGRCKGVFDLGALPGGSGPLTWSLRATDPAALRSALEAEGHPWKALKDGRMEVSLGSEVEVAELVAHLVGVGVRIVEVMPTGRGLEGAFMALEDRP
jgi:ABC-2 type transport system ATP-binding protein